MSGSRHNVSVSIRIRPGGSGIVRPSHGGVIANGNAFNYPTSVLEGSDQHRAKEALAGRLVRKFCEGGLSSTLIAYGQTGSGKTYTMFGPPGSLTETALKEAGDGKVPELWGVFPRVMLDLLRASELSGATFYASAIEIYMEHGYDLLAGRKPIKIGSVKGAGRGNIIAADIGKSPIYAGASLIVGGLHPSGCSCFKCFNDQSKKPSGAAKVKNSAVATSSKAFRASASTDLGEKFGTEGEVMWPLRDPSDVAKLTRLVESERVAHGHALNARSSRSHCIVRLHCTLVEGGKSQKRLFVFVDLAGSERIAKSEVTGARQKEASNINQSLTTLGRVVNELTSRKDHVSYRDSALTMLLRASFSGPSTTNVVINVSDDEGHIDETLCSLRFGEKLAGVKTSAIAAKAVDVRAQREQVASELAEAQARLEDMKRAGYGDHINSNAPSSEQTSLSKNIATLRERTREVRVLKQRLVEIKASGDESMIESLSQTLEKAIFAHSNIHDIVERQKTIPGLWVSATPAFLRVEAQVVALRGQLDILGPSGA